MAAADGAASDGATGGEHPDDHGIADGAVDVAVGVGPWPGPWPTDPRYDPELLAHGDRRNVADAYRYWTVAAIAADLERRRHAFSVAVENWQHDANIGSIVRTANAFNAAGVHIVGRRRWNRRGAMVTDRYLQVTHHADLDDLAHTAAAAGQVLIGVDNVPGAEPIETFDLPRRCVLLFGQEGPGLSAGALAACAGVVGITQYGSTRSINVGAAAAIVMHAWIRRHVWDQVPDSGAAAGERGTASISGRRPRSDNSSATRTAGADSSGSR